MSSSRPLPSPRGLTIIQAPTNLGLRPLRPGPEPGVWRAPKALEAAGLHERLGAVEVVRLPRPQYRSGPRPGSGILNGPEVRAYSESVAVAVRAAIADHTVPVVVGGDCSLLLGCLLGARICGSVGLIHVDGHSDFKHPGNYDAGAGPSAAAGMDLALATGRGEALLASWDGAPLVEDVHVVQIGEREELDPD